MKKHSVVILLVLFFLASCASLPKNYPRISSTAYKNFKATRVGQLFEKETVNHPGKSGFSIIRYGRQAFTARIAMTEMAEKSLDLQYYLWEPDATGQLLAYHVIKAADRGVKVRVLVDDVGLSGRDAVIAAMDAHPNIQIRIFNPFSHRKMHFLDFLSDFNRINHRMHNKTLVMDNTVAIIGGRNISNQYFGVSNDNNFLDLDIAAAGPIVREISGVYDHFWNGDWAVPIAALAKRAYSNKDLLAVTQTLQKKIASGNFPYPLAKNIKILRSELISIRDSFIWARGEIVWDDPKTMQKHVNQQQGTMIQKLQERVRSVQKNLHIESAYFVPRNSGVSALKRLYNRGVKVRILTNSLASNDVLVAHAGFAAYRKQLVKNGVELYELRPDAGNNAIINKKLSSGTAKSSLHAKAMVFDNKALFIGSFNLDPRSAAINTEGGLYVESPKLAKQVVAYMDESVKPNNSYRIKMDKNGNLTWMTQINGKQVIYHTEPETSGWQRFKSGFIRLLPIQLQL